MRPRDVTVLVLCGRSPRHLYVANQLCASTHVAAIVQETGSPVAVNVLRNLRRPNIIARKAWRWMRDRRRYIGDREAKFFFGDLPPRLDRPDLIVQVNTVNDPVVVDLAERHNPDLIAVFGTSLIRGPLLDMGRHGMLNLHGGLSPHYRGADCTFWALYNREPQRIGCTIHFIDRGIDTGRLIAHVCPEIGPADDELSLFWRGVRDAADVYAEAILRLGSGESLGVQQNEKGSLYQVKQRGLRHEIAVQRLLAGGLLRDVRLPRRVQWFNADTQHSAAETSLIGTA
ncbi:MAG TPA: formyl transferase [Burkholderiales bacterium]|nr:formyl transferase [Burkholderiales bacterium]